MKFRFVIYENSKSLELGLQVYKWFKFRTLFEHTNYGYGSLTEELIFSSFEEGIEHLIKSSSKVNIKLVEYPSLYIKYIEKK